MALPRLSLLTLLLVAGCVHPDTPEGRAQRARKVRAEVAAAANQPLPMGCVDRLKVAEITPAKASTSLPPRYGGEGGGLSKKLIHDVIHARGEQVEACYWEAQQGKPLLEGRVDVRFVISLTGEVCAAEARQNTTGSEALERCLLGQVARMRFPAPTGGDVIVVYPYLFNPPQAARAGALSDGP